MSLLCLVMIVKDEARGIRATLESVKPWIDRWLILDTGSTDGTQTIVREVMSGVAGDLVEEPFVDFATTRNRALELAGERCAFALMLSGDEILRGGAGLRAFCESNPEQEAFDMTVELDGCYQSARLARTGKGWWYSGVTHEVLMKHGAGAPVAVDPALCTIYHDLSHRDPAANRRRWQRDKLLLLVELAREPRDTRTAFYLAQTFYCLGEYDLADHYYRHRIGMGGWSEEIYESMFRLGHIARYQNLPWQEVQQRYLDAHAYAPHRAEPLYQIAEHWLKADSHSLAFLFGQRACDLPYPQNDRLFVSKAVYNYNRWDLVGISAFYVGEYERGRLAVQHALVAIPGDARLLKNLHHYEARLAP